MQDKITEPLFLTWNDALAIGVKEIDDDHQRLLGIFDHFTQSVANNDSESRVTETLSQLLNYTETHFLREEAAMAETGFPDLAQHRQEHDALRAHVYDLLAENGASRETAARLAAFLGRWLLGHILDHDRRFGDYIHQRPAARCGRRAGPAAPDTAPV